MHIGVSPMSSRFGKFFKRKDAEVQTPPKALYDDLESAHESITRKTNESSLQEASRQRHTIGNGQLSTLLTFPSKPIDVGNYRVRSIASAFDSKQGSTASSNARATFSKTQIAHSSGTGRQMDSSVDLEHNQQSSSCIDHISSWQTVGSESRLDASNGRSSIIPQSKPMGLQMTHHRINPAAPPLGDLDFSPSSYEKIHVDEQEVDAFAPSDNLRVCAANEEQKQSLESSLFRLDNIKLPAWANDDHEDLQKYAWSPCSSRTSSTEHQHTNPRLHYAQDPSEGAEKATNVCDTASGSEDDLLVDPHKNLVSTGEMSMAASEIALSSMDLQLPRDPNVARLVPGSHLHECDSPHPLAQGKIHRFSGIISDGHSSRPMSQAELGDSLDQIIRLTLRRSMITDTDTMNSAMAHVCEHEWQGKKLSAGDLDIHTALNSFCQREQDHGEHGKVLVCGETSKQHGPKTTSPGLFGRLARGPFRHSHEKGLHSLVRKDSRLAKAAAAAGVRENGRLGMALAGPTKEGQELKQKNTLSSSMVASPSMPAVRAMATGHDIRARREHSCESFVTEDAVEVAAMDQYPRQNCSWSLVRNQANGRIAIVPDRISRGSDRLPRVDAGSRVPASGHVVVGQHSHPMPLPKDHPSQLAVSLYVSPNRIEPCPESPQIERGSLTTQQKCLQRQLTSSKMSRSSTESAGLYTPTKDVDHTQSISKIGDRDDDLSVHRLVEGRRSSTWLSTVSEALSNDLRVPARINSFSKATITGQNGNFTGTPDDMGARETGSSLADGSSISEDMSQRSHPLSNPVIMPRTSSGLRVGAYMATDGEALQAFHRGFNKDGLSESETAGYPAALPSQSLYGLLVKRADNVKDTAFTVPRNQSLLRERHSELLPSAAVFSGQRSTYLHQLSPFESLGTTSDAEPNWQDYLPPLTPNRAAHGLGLHKDSSPDVLRLEQQGKENDTKWHGLQNVIGIKNKAVLLDLPKWRAATANSFVVDSQTRSPSPLLRQGLSLEDPPRLYDTICKPDGIMQAKQKHYSRLWAFFCLFIPFLGPIFGHGYLDRIMLWHSAGSITGFRRQEKLFVLVYSYFLFAAVLVALAVTMAVLSP